MVNEIHRFRVNGEWFTVLLFRVYGLGFTTFG